MERSERQNTKNTFFTETDLPYAKWQSCKSVFLIYLVLAVLASVGMLISLQTFLYFEAFAFIIAVFTFFITQKNTHDYRLHFENDMIHITDKTTGESFWVYDVPASDFIFVQTKKEKKVNVCDMAIKQTVFMFPCLKHGDELKRYVSENFQ